MKQGRLFGFSAEQKLDVWRRWKAGQTLHEIGRAFGKEHSSIRCTCEGDCEGRSGHTASSLLVSYKEILTVFVPTS